MLPFAFRRHIGRLECEQKEHGRCEIALPVVLGTTGAQTVEAAEPLVAHEAERAAMAMAETQRGRRPCRYRRSLLIHRLGMGWTCLLINNAGVSGNRPAMEITPEEWRRVIAINLDGVVFFAQAVGRRMQRQGNGVIINIGSIYSSVAAQTASYIARPRPRRDDHQGTGGRVGATQHPCQRVGTGLRAD